jgi:hypothetical protein
MKRPPPKGLRAIIPNKNEYVQHSTYGEHQFSPHPRTQEQSSPLSENSEENLVFFTMLAFYIKGRRQQDFRYRGTQFRGLFRSKGEPRSKRRRMFKS